jgi:hypothetical protein
MHEEVRKMQRENNELRMKNNQRAAALELVTKERDDLQWQVKQLQGALARKFGKTGVDMLPTIKAMA